MFGPFARIYEDLRGADGMELLDQALLDSESLDVRHERYPVMAALKTFLIARTPCVVIIDDMHRANPATIEVLEYLIRNTLELANESIAVVVSPTRDCTSKVGAAPPI